MNALSPKAMLEAPGPAVFAAKPQPSPWDEHVAIMPGVRRSPLAVEAARRNQEQLLRIGGQVRTMRERRGWTRTEHAQRAGIGRMVEGRLEGGTTNVNLDALQRIGIALGGPVVVTFQRDIHEALADAGHLGMQELLLRVGRAAGYSGTFELPTRPIEPWRSVDIGLAADWDHRMILAECWNTFGDVGAAARATNRKRSDLEDLAVGRWGASARVSVVWVVRATARNRALIGRYPEVFASRFPASSRAWVAALTGGTRPPAEPGLVWSDVGATRLFEWRRG